MPAAPPRYEVHAAPLKHLLSLPESAVAPAFLRTPPWHDYLRFAAAARGGGPPPRPPAVCRPARTVGLAVARLVVLINLRRREQQLAEIHGNVENTMGDSMDRYDAFACLTLFCRPDSPGSTPRPQRRKHPPLQAPPHHKRPVANRPAGASPCTRSKRCSGAPAPYPPPTVTHQETLAASCEPQKSRYSSA